MFSKLKLISLVFAIACAPHSAAMASVKRVDFSGKKIQLIVPYREGGGSDTYARLFTPFLEKYLPGKPKILIRNMPGGGSIKGSNWFERKATPDGLMFVATSSSTMVSQIFAGKKRKFDMLKWSQLIVSSRGTIVYFSPKTGVKGKDIVADIKRLRSQHLFYGAKNPTAGELRTIIAVELLGMDVETVFGLSRGRARRAVMRGELTVNHETAGAYFMKVKRYADKGKIVPLFTLGFPRDGKIIRDPAFPDMVTVPEIYKMLNGEYPSGGQWEAYKNMLVLGVTASKGLALPKNTPAKVVKAYVEALKKTVKDKEFLKIAKDRLGPYPQVYGKAAQQAVLNAVTLSPAASKWLKVFLEGKFSIKIKY